MTLLDELIVDALGNVDDLRAGAGKNGTQFARHLAIHGELDALLRPILKQLYKADYHEAEVMKNLGMLVRQVWQSKLVRMDEEMKTFRVGDAVQQKGTGLNGPIGVVTKIHTWTECQYEVMFPNESGPEKQYFSPPYINHAGNNHLEPLKEENLF